MQLSMTTKILDFEYIVLFKNKKKKCWSVSEAGPVSEILLEIFFSTLGVEEILKS